MRAIAEIRMFGILNVNKPAGLTSRDVVNRVQRVVRPVKVGHAGTLDPLATGVLLVCLGPATRLVPYLQQTSKRYTGTFLLGRRSNTEDIEGAVVELDNPPQPALEQITHVLPKFIGTIDQRPPAFSALKIKGRRAYTLARQGKDVELATRKITIHSIDVVDYQYPELKLDISCGSGTYIRSLGRDIAQALDTQAVMSALERTKIGSFCVEEAVELKTLDSQSIAENLCSPLSAVQSLSSIRLTAQEAEAVSHGRAIFSRKDYSPGELAAVNPSGQLVAILAGKSSGRLCVVRNFSAPVS